MSEIRKKISIASNGPLAIYGGIFGPIRSPFYETIQNISSLISSGADVYEHVNGKKIKLDMVNFDKDFTGVQGKPVATVKQAVQAPVKNDDIIKIPAQNKNQGQNQNFNKKNKQHQQQQNVQVEKVQDEAQQVVADEVSIES